MGHKSVVVVGGGIMGVSAAYWLAMKGASVTLLDLGEVPNRWAASGDHLRAFGLGYGKDSFYSELAARAMPLWLDLNAQAQDKILFQNGVLNLAVSAHGETEQSLRVLKEMRSPVEKLDKQAIKRRYPMINTRAVSWALFQKQGGILWANRAVQALAGLAQRKGVKVKLRTAVAAVIKGKDGIRAVRDSSGHLWAAESFVFAAGAWMPQLLSGYRLPIRVTRQEQLFLKPPLNSGRYRAEHFPVFSVPKLGFYGFPLHIHGFLKISNHRLGPAEKPKSELPKSGSPAFEKKCRAFLGRFIPDLANFSDFETSVGYYDNTKDGDFIVDRLPGAPNAVALCGFSGHGFKFGPLIGQAAADLIMGGKPEVNLHRFRLSRFKGGK